MKFSKLKRSVFVAMILVFAISTGVLALNNSKTDKERPIEDGFNMDEINKMKAQARPLTYEESEAQLVKAAEERANSKLPTEKVIELYKQGYGYNDISYAEYLSKISEYKVEDILKEKGKSSINVNNKDGQSPRVEVSGKSWEEVTTKLGIDTRKPTEKLDMPDELVEELKENNLSEKEILELGILAKKYSKPHKEILNKFKSGKKLGELAKQYQEEQDAASKKSAKSQEDMKIEMEESIKKRYKISDEDIEKARKHGVKEILDIGCAKEIAEKGNISFEKVLKQKKDKNSWKDVKNELGVK